jgi:esterase
LVPDLRNHGQSPHRDDASYAAMSGDLLHLLDRLELPRAIVVGHSMGGKVGMLLALTQPQRVSGVAVVDMAPVSYDHHFDEVFQAFDAVDLDGLEKRSEADAQMAPFVPQPGVRAFLQQNLYKSDEGWRWRCNLKVLRAAQSLITGFSTPRGAVYNGPAAFIHGTESDYLKPAYRPAITALFPRATVCPVAGAGHWVYAEKPQGFAECLEPLLRSID